MLYLRHQVRPFVILMQAGRTGSTFLTQALDSHPNIRCQGEILVGTKHIGAQKQLQIAREQLTPAFVSPYRAIGFKTKLTDVVDPEGFAALLNAAGVYVILSRRSNLVKLVISWINSERLYRATGAWNLLSEATRLPPFSVDINDFDIRLQQVEQQNWKFGDYIQTLQMPAMEVYYEDLVVATQHEFERIFSFLGVNNVSVQSTTLKNTSDNLAEVVTNFEELRSFYANTHYWQMFEGFTLAGRNMTRAMEKL